MKEKNYVHFLHKPHTNFFSLKKYILRFQVEKNMKEGKATPDWDYLHMLRYYWKVL